MKKILTVFIILLLLLTASSCKWIFPDKNNDCKNKLVSDESHHWCACADCNTKKPNKEDHSFKGGICTVCSTTDGVIYELSANEKYALVTGYEGEAKEVRIADEYSGVPVTEIGAGAFRTKTSILEITLPDNVKFIRDNAFYTCTSLMKISLPDGISDVASTAFVNCWQLEYNTYDNARYTGTSSNPYLILISAKDDSIKDCKVNENTKFILEGAFTNCNDLESLTVPDSIISIDGALPENAPSLVYNAYDNAYYLGNESNPYAVLVKAKSNVIEACEINPNTGVIYTGAFKDCASIKSIVVPNSVVYIGGGAFSGCKNMTSLTLPSGLTSISSNMLYSCHALKSITIPEGVNTIKPNAFSSCSSLTSLKIPSGVTNIGGYAFESCTSLIDVYISDNVNVISRNAFLNCNNLKYTEYGNAYYLGNEDNPHIALIKAKDTSVSECEINKNTRLILPYAFSDCSQLKSVSIPEEVRFLGDYAFLKCSSLDSVTVNARLSGIKIGTFHECTSLKNLTLPDGISYIEGYAFKRCSSLSQITIPDGVVLIDEEAFAYCASLTNVILPDSIKNVTTAFSDCDSLAYNEYENAYYLGNNENPYVALIKAKSTAISECKINEKTKIIATHAFYECASLGSISIPDGVTHVYSGAFSNCSSLTDVSAGNGIIHLPDYVFSECTNLKSISLPQNLRVIGANAFSSCTSLKTLHLPSEIVVISNYAFKNCSSLESISLPESLKILGGMVFYNCNSLKGITIPAGVNSLTYTFINCPALESVVITKGVKSIYHAFSNCPVLKDIYYTGTEEDWAEIDYVDELPSYTNATVHFNHK